MTQQMQQPAAPTTRDPAAQEVSVARLTAKAELVMEELMTVVMDMAELLKAGAVDAGQQQ